MTTQDFKDEILSKIEKARLRGADEITLRSGELQTEWGLKNTPPDLRCHEVPLPPRGQNPRIAKNSCFRCRETYQHRWKKFRTTIQRTTISRRQVGGCLFDEDGQERIRNNKNMAFASLPHKKKVDWIVHQATTITIPLGDSYLQTYPYMVDGIKYLMPLNDEKLLIAGSSIFSWMPTQSKIDTTLLSASLKIITSLKTHSHLQKRI